LAENKQKKVSKPVRIVNPDLYNIIADTFFETHNLHPHDFQADLSEESEGYQLRLSFGEQFRASEEIFLTDEDIDEKSDKLTSFLKETANTCREVMVKDYFKMMKP